MSLLAVRFLMGLETRPHILESDGLSELVSMVEHRRNPDCPFHDRLPAAKRVPLGPDATVGDLRAHLAPGYVPLAWRPLQLRVECRRCGFAQGRVGRVRQDDCPSCGTPLRSRTSLEMSTAPDFVRLSSLGIPAREIFAVRETDGLAYIELTQ